MPEEISAAPGWVDERLDTIFAPLAGNTGVEDARRAYSACLAVSKSPSTPSDMLGAEFEPCRTALHRALRAAGLASDLVALDPQLEALEAEIAADS